MQTVHFRFLWDTVAQCVITLFLTCFNHKFSFPPFMNLAFLCLVSGPLATSSLYIPVGLW